MASEAAGEFNLAVTEEDIPETIASFIIDQPFDNPEAVVRRREQWQQLPPHLKGLIITSAFQVAPEDLGLRGQVTSRILDVLAGLDGAAESHRLDEYFNHSGSEANVIPIEITDKRRLRRGGILRVGAVAMFLQRRSPKKESKEY